MKAICVGARHRKYNKVDKASGVVTPVDETILYIVHSSPMEGLSGRVVKALSLPYGRFNLVEELYNELVVDRELLIDLIPYGDSFLIEDIVPGNKVIM